MTRRYDFVMTTRIKNPPATCTIDDCERPYCARGYCKLHYARMTNGTPLDAPPRDNRPGTPDERFDRKWTLDPYTGCHVWLEHLVGGYGQFRIERGVQVMAHTYAHERAHGPLPAGLVLDHICHPDDGSCPGGPCAHRRCCNPDHVRPVTRGENTLRSATGRSAINARRTHCKRGHELPPYVPGGKRHCRTCASERVYPSWARTG
jgi:hypothetical protein